MDYKSSFLTTANSEETFNAITKEINKWWGRVDNPVEKSGDEFSVYFGRTEWRFKILDYVKNETLTWHCVKANHIHDGLHDIQEEWLNTTVEWKIKQIEGKTEIKLVHKGLTHNLNCYEVCKSGWDYFLQSSLKNYLDNGKGTPHILE